jgi:alpha-galactosidase
MQFLLWFVPESVQPGIEVGESHLEWILEPFQNAAYGDHVFYGLDHGDPAVNTFVIEHYANIVGGYGVDVFRQDGLSLWPRDTGPDRQGLSQIRYTEGFYAFWDGLLERHPGLLIDNCGTGARKLDLETIRRSMVLWRSDCQASAVFDPLISQNFTQGLAPWVLLFGDFRALTRYSPANDAWVAWQWDRPDLGRGMVQAFRRPDCQVETLTVRLGGLNPDVLYRLTDRDRPGLRQVSGGELMEGGLQLALADAPAAAILVYERVD